MTNWIGLNETIKWICLPWPNVRCTDERATLNKITFHILIRPKFQGFRCSFQFFSALSPLLCMIFFSRVLLLLLLVLVCKTYYVIYCLNFVSQFSTSEFQLCKTQCSQWIEEENVCTVIILIFFLFNYIVETMN